MSEALFQFDEPTRGAGDPLNATVRIANTLSSAGIDAPAALYDEALLLAREGHLGLAYARLQMLLCLDPDDADALFLMAKVHAAQNRPAEALARLDASVSAGALPPVGFREQLEAMLRAERSREDENRARVAAREQGEIRSLRTETRTLRSDNIRLEGEITDTRRREQGWKYAATGASLFGTAVILILAVLGGREPEGRPPEIPLSPVSAASAAAPPPQAAEVAPVEAAPVEAAPVEAAPVVEVASAVEPAPARRVHVVGQDETLGKLALKYYGSSAKWEKIRDANHATLKGGIALSIGMELTIPD